MSLLDYCNTDRQREIVALYEQGLTMTEIARQLGGKRNIVSESYHRVAKRAALQGYSPDHDMTKTVPPGFSVKGVSTYYNDEGKPIGQWVKSQADAQMREEMLRGFVEGLCEGVKPAKPQKMPKRAKLHKDLMPSIFIGDAHIGMKAFGIETKHHDFDTKIATSQLRQAFDYLVNLAEPSEQSLFVNVGDLIHANTQHGTTVSGTPLDNDTRHYSVMRAAAQTMAYGINLKLTKHRHVTVVMARGNHDSDAAGAVQLMLDFYYKDEPRVTVLPTHGFYHYLEYGKWLLGIHHGNSQKPASLASSMARDMAEAWGRTTHRMWCTGHYHKEAVQTLPGVKHKIFGALPPPDSWHAAHGFAGDGEMEMLTFRKGGGLHSSFVFNVPQPRIEPDLRID
jgi:UDP-2,3-diacylglucosamine pyrophosphatase LpxH